MIEDKPHFDALTGIRIVAAYLVWAHHFNPFSENLLGGSVYRFFAACHVGVTIFFVLSGFLIAYRYFDKKIEWKKYFLNRMARIYPIYFVLTTLTFMAIFAKNLISNTHYPIIVPYLSSITFLKGYFNVLKFEGIRQGWSLTVEETFYVLVPSIFFMIKKNKSYLFLLPLFFIAIGCAVVYLSNGCGTYEFMSSYHFMFTYTFLGRCTEFFIGIALFLYLKSINFKSNFKSKWFTYLGSVSTVFCIYLLSLDGFGIQTVPGKVINTLILPILGIAPLFYGLIMEKTPIAKVLSSRISVLLGKSSYAFYLVHMGVLSMAIHLVTKSNLVLFVLTNIAAVALYLYAEEPVNKKIRSLWGQL